MRNKTSILSVLPFLLVFIGACGGSNHTNTPGEVPVVISISDQPSNIGVLSFDIQITGACLLTSANAMATSCSGAQNLLPEAPMTVQLENLQSPLQPDVLATTNVQAGTYTTVLITFGTATTAVNVDPNSTDQDTATPPNSCTAAATPTICELSPTLTSSSVTLPLSSAAALSTGQPTSVSIDFSVADSLVGATAGRTTTFTITPVTAVGVTTVASTGNSLIDISDVTGPVTDVGASNFTLTDSTTEQPVTVATFSGTTAFNGFSGCNNNLACVQIGQLVTVNYGVSNTSTPELTASSITNNNGFSPASAFEATIVATTPTPMVVVTAVPAGNTQGVIVGQVFTLEPPAASSGFSAAVPAGQTLPAGLTFAGAGDLLVGQNVLIDSTGIIVSGNISTITADQIALEPTQFSGTVDTLTKPNLTVNGLNGFFTDNGIPTIQVQTGTQTTFGGTVAATGFSGITVGDQANFDGFLFNGGAGQNPIVFGESIFDDTLTAGLVKRSN